MADFQPGTEPLRLRDDFPPVSREAWETAIRNDLKGADYDKKLVWRSDEGIAVRPYYRREDIFGLKDVLAAPPGEFPFVRGGGRPWEIAPDGFPEGEDAIRADHFHEAGGSAIQTLGYALAAGIERLQALVERGLPVDAAARRIEFVFAVSSNFFFEIAKLRAARLLWAQAVAAFHPEQENSCLMRIYVRTSRLNKSVYDRYTNLLRATTEALSAVIGGCDRLTVEPFGFDAHLALNVQRILKEESHVDIPADPAGGSYFVEVLTDSLAREAWKLFQQVEAEGGYTAALRPGSIEKAIAQTRGQREAAVASRRRVLVGLNNYPDLKEKVPGFEPAPPEREDRFPQFRLAEPFERIRERTARHALLEGRYPRVLLLERGDVKMRMARANFCRNFFGCAGFDIEESEDYERKPADLIVLCSSDAEYLALAREVCPRVQVPVIVAGNPKEEIEALKAAGVQGFVHVASDAVQTLTEWQNRLGIQE